MKRSQIKGTNTVTTDKIKNILKKMSLVVFAAGIALTGCGPDEEENKPDIETEVQDEDREDIFKDDEAEPVKPEPDTEEQDEDDGTAEEAKGQTGNNDKTQGSTTQTTSRPSKDPSLASYWTKLENTAKAGQNYYSEYYTKTRVTTQNGYLYNYAAGTQITANYLIGEGRLSSSATSSGISIMLMYGRDIASCGGSSVHITGTDREFTVFAFMRHPSEARYIFASSNGSYGNMSESAYNALMGMYSMNHGTVRRLTPSNSEYDRILSCIKMYESKYEDYFVRSITIDDKYAFVVLSGRSNAATIREYILRYDNGIWEVVMDDLEAEGRLPVIVNKTLPDFNMSMLPSYSIKDFTMLTDYTAVMDALTRAGYYEKDDTFYYFCGTEDFCYMITDSGKRFLCHNNNGTWDCYWVLDYYEALSRLQRLSSNPPTFILLDLE